MIYQRNRKRKPECHQSYPEELQVSSTTKNVRKYNLFILYLGNLVTCEHQFNVYFQDNNIPIFHFIGFSVTVYLMKFYFKRNTDFYQSSTAKQCYLKYWKKKKTKNPPTYPKNRPLQINPGLVINSLNEGR